MRAAWLAAGWLLFGVGVIGVIVPGLPTTPPLLLALACFARGSDHLHDWLLGHRVFGPPLQRWRRHRVIAVRAKVTAVTMMLGSFAYLWGWSSLPVWGVLAIGAVMLVGIVVVLRIPHSIARDDASPYPTPPTRGSGPESAG